MNALETKPAKKAAFNEWVYRIEQAGAYVSFLILPWLIFAYLLLKNIF